ncbi:MAG: CTL/SLC44 family protein [Ketobacter sp.]|nr:CTL/SLC44 family protein [Ketobacter sp.]
MSDRRQRILELEADYAVPETWKDGPVQNVYRGCTDVCCLIIFILYCILMIATMITAFANSDPENMYKVYDSEANDCGKDDFADYPLLFFQTFEKPFRSVCVKECPRFDYNKIKYGDKVPETSAVTQPVQAESTRLLEDENTPEEENDEDVGESNPNDSDSPMYFDEFNNQHAGLSTTRDPNFAEAEAFAYDEKWFNGYFTEDQYWAYQQKFVLECKPNADISSCKFDRQNMVFYDTYPVLGIVCMPNSPKAALLFNKLSIHFNQGVIGDMSEASHMFLWVALISLGMGLLFLMLLCCCAGLLTWFLILVLGLTLIAFGGIIIANYAYTGPLNDGINAARVKYLSFLMTNKGWFITLAVVLILLGLFVFYFMCKFRKNINISIPMMKYAAKTTLKNILLIFLSIFTVVIQFCVLFLELYIILRLYTTGKEVTNKETGSPFIHYELDSWIEFQIFVHFFGMIWIIIVLNNFNDYVCAAITVNGYYNRGIITNIRIFCHCLGHNVGTVAWSIVLLPALLLKMVFGAFDYCLTSDNPNGCQRFFNKLCCLCCKCYEFFVDSISENYFPISYMGSEGFCKATRRYYYLSERYHDLTSTVLIVAGLFALVGKLLISFFAMSCGYWIYKRDRELQQNIDYIGTMLFLCFVIGFLVGSLFINLFSTCFEATVACFLCEKDLQEVRGLAIDNCPDELREVVSELNNEYRELN